MHLDMMRLIVISHHGHWTFLADDCRNWSNISELCKYIHGTYVAMLSLVFLYILLLAASDMSKVTVYCCQRDCQWGKCKEYSSASILGIPNISYLFWEIPIHLHKSPMNRIISQTFLFYLGSSYVSTWHFLFIVVSLALNKPRQPMYYQSNQKTRQPMQPW